MKTSLVDGLHRVSEYDLYTGAGATGSPPGMWPHACGVQGNLMIGAGEDCPWCGAVEKSAPQREALEPVTLTLNSVNQSDPRAMAMFQALVDGKCRSGLAPAVVVQGVDFNALAAITDAPARQRAVEGVELPPMPPTVDRRPYLEDEPDGYLEGNRDWADNNREAVDWLIENHVAIRAALSPERADISPRREMGE